MKIDPRFLLAAVVLALAGTTAHPPAASAHLIGSPIHDSAATGAVPGSDPLLFIPRYLTAPAGNGALMSSSFTPFRPKVRFYWDSTYFYEESDGMPDRTLTPNLMVGITSWQQHFPLFTSYFAFTINPENDTNSLGYGQPNVWKFPLVPSPAAVPLLLSSNNFQRGAVALAVNGVPIFNPRNNTGRFSYEIGELDQYGGHCGKADDYHYHIVPVHLQSVVGSNLPVAWALDGYPMYGYTEPDGSAQQALDADGGHTNVTGSYHYHAIGTAAAGPQNPYLMNAFHGTVVNYGGQVDGQPEVGSLRQTNTFGFQDKPVSGASITAFMNPVALSNDVSGHFMLDSNGIASADQYLMRFGVAGTNYDICWRINRNANPKTLTVTWRMPGYPPFTTNYNNSNNRLTAYPMAASSLLLLPDTGQTNFAGAVPGQDADYAIHVPSFTDNGNGTVTDTNTGLMWQKTDNGESTWEYAVTNARNVAVGGYSDWRLPTPAELFSMLNLNNNPAVDTNYFPNNPAGAAGYWWTTDIYGTNYASVWCANSGGGLGPKPKTETISAGGVLRYHARYVRGGAPSNGHNYLNDGDGTVTDLDTGLMWQQVPSAATHWSAALTNAEIFSLGGHTDWRLPNIKELQTLTDYTLATATTAGAAKACVNRILFPTNTTPATAYWSSTPLRPVTGNQAWVVELGVNNASSPPRNAQGIISYNTNTASYPFFCVRGPDQNFVMATPARTVSAVQVSWAAVPGRTYSVYYSPALNSAAWTNIGSLRCNGTSGSFADTNLAHATAGVGFYKASYVP